VGYGGMFSKGFPTQTPTLMGEQKSFQTSMVFKILSPRMEVLLLCKSKALSSNPRPTKKKLSPKNPFSGN
jgi:hypothetical protein